MLKISDIIKNRFIKSSGIVLIGSLTANVLNYVFNLVMGRMLSPVEYGEMAALITLVMIMVVPSTTLITLLAKYTAEYQARREYILISRLFRLATRYALLFGTGLLIIFWLLIPAISDFLRAQTWPLIIFSLLLPISLVSGASIGALQGLQKFIPFTVKGVIEVVSKLGLSVLFVLLGFSVSGVILALVIGSLLAYLYSLLKLKPYISSSKDETEDDSCNCRLQATPGLYKGILQKMIGYLIVIFWASLFLAVFGNIDVILAKHYLSAHDAGQYAALAVIGRIMTYGSIAITAVMFPMASAAHASGNGRSGRLLKMSLGLIIIISLFILILFISIPEFVVLVLFGSNYLSIAPYLGLFGLVMLFGALAKVLVSYFMATHNKVFVYPFGILTVLQIVLIVIFHQNIIQIIYSLLATSFLLFVVLLAMYGGTKPIKMG